MKTTVPLFITQERDYIEKPTYVCFGSPRCGTSMVAGAMLGLGIDMGIDLPVNVEDPIFNIDGKRGNKPKFVQNVIAEIANRNATHDLWGWKYPRAIDYLPDIISEIRNPQLVIVYRDPIPSVIRAVDKTEPSQSQDHVAYREIDKCIRLFRRNTEFAKEHECPTLLVSYERASQMPEVFLKELATFCSLDLPQDTSPTIEFMKPGRYKNPNSLRQG